MIFNYLKLCVSRAEPHRSMCLVDQLAKFSLQTQSVILTHVKLCSFVLCPPHPNELYKPENCYVLSILSQIDLMVSCHEAFNAH